MSRASAALQRDIIGRSRSGGVRRGEVEAAPYAERGGGPRGAGRLVSSVDRPGIKTTIVQSRYQINDDLYLDLPRGAVPRLGDTYMSYVLGPNLGDNGQVVIPTGILRIENFSPGQRRKRILAPNQIMPFRQAPRRGRNPPQTDSLCCSGPSCWISWRSREQKK